jgi:hypothetical protein
MSTKEKTESLTVEEIIWAAANSDSKGVQDALQKLEMMVRLAHPDDTLREMMKARPEYKLRLGIPTKIGPFGYEYLRVGFVGNAVDLSLGDWTCFVTLNTHTENVVYIT